MTPRVAELSLEVVLRAQQSDRAAQALVLARYARPLRALARRVLPDRDADEVTQALLERVLAVLPRFDPQGSATLTTWVFTVAHHYLIDCRRRPTLVTARLDDELAHDSMRASDDPSHDVWRRQVRTALERAIADLPEEQRRLFVLVHLNGHPLEAAAEVEGVPLGTVKSRLFRAKAQLAHRLQGLLDSEGVTR